MIGFKPDEGVTHRERMETCLAGEKPDRTPVALWRHFPVDDQSPEGLAGAVIDFQRRYDFDFVKVTPASSFCLKDWGVDDEWRGATEGTRDYTKRVIRHPEDWADLPILDPEAGYLGAQLASLRQIIAGLGPDVPVIQTIFSPLSQAKNLVSRDTLLVHLRRDPEAVQAGLRTIAETTSRYVESVLETGVAGVFYAVQHAQLGLLSEEEYLKFGRPYDLLVLEPAQDAWLNVLHIHGSEIMFNSFVDYPVSVINWHDQETSPTLAEAQKQFSGAVCGGLKREEDMVLGTPDQISKQALESIRNTDGYRFILGTGCVVPITAPRGNILVVRRAVEQ